MGQICCSQKKQPVLPENYQAINRELKVDRGCSKDQGDAAGPSTAGLAAQDTGDGILPPSLDQQEQLGDKDAELLARESVGKT